MSIYHTNMYVLYVHVYEIYYVTYNELKNLFIVLIE